MSQLHQSDGSSFERNDDGFYVARCDCGYEMGPLPDVETVTDVLMSHAFQAGWDGARREVEKR